MCQYGFLGKSREREQSLRACGDGGQAAPERRQDLLFMATILKALGIDAHKEYTLGNRPITVLDDKAEPIAELFA